MSEEAAMNPVSLPAIATAGIPTPEQALEAMKVVKDPEIPVNIVDLGLVYKVEISEDVSNV